MSHAVDAGDSFRIPSCCACCLGEAEETLPVSVQHQGVIENTTVTWEFPYCSRCVAHVRAHNLSWLVGAVPGAIVALAFMGFGDFKAATTLFGFLIGGALMVAVRYFVAPALVRTGRECAGEAALVGCQLMGGGRYRFHFANARFAKKFEEINGDLGG